MEKAVPVLLVAAAMGANRVLPNDKVRQKLTAVFYRLGVLLTLGISKHPKVGPVWNRTVEPVVVDFLDNLAYAVREGLVKGLRSDDEGGEAGAALLQADAVTQTEEADPAPRRPWWRAR